MCVLKKGTGEEQGGLMGDKVREIKKGENQRKKRIDEDI